LATIADHIEPHRGNWTAFLTGKLQSLCSHCHESAKKFDDNKQVLDQDGWPQNGRTADPCRSLPLAK
jgi:hypothetical protein